MARRKSSARKDLRPQQQDNPKQEQVKRGPGRPPKPEWDSRKKLSIMLTPLERAAVERRAAQDGEALAESARNYLLDGLHREVAQARARAKRAEARRKKRPQAAVA